MIAWRGDLVEEQTVVIPAVFERNSSAPSIDGLPVYF
jgi:hypothetical protein